MCVKPSHPRRMPTTSRPISFDRYTTLLMTGFSPGTSPPPVKIPIRFFAPIDPFLLSCDPFGAEYLTRFRARREEVLGVESRVFVRGRKQTVASDECASTT